MTEVKNILLVGVGGQGTILVSKILSTGLVNAGYDVKMSEVHGMAQRGGSVTTQVRYGKEVFSPIIGMGQADVLVSFEAMEALRYLGNVKVGGKVIVNDYRIPSAPILSGAEDYPMEVLSVLKEKADTTVIDAAAMAAGVGNSRTMNMVLFGAMVSAMDLESFDWATAIREHVKENLVEVNLRAFAAGAAAVSKETPVAI
jgi:indolepyruvate ferredoxin oxidoreductase beta subunit